MRDAFESVQDAVDLPGLLTWHAELARVVAANLAAEMRGCVCACADSLLPKGTRATGHRKLESQFKGCS